MEIGNSKGHPGDMKNKREVKLDIDRTGLFLWGDRMESHMPDCCIFSECQAFETSLECSIMLILCRENTWICCSSLLTECISTTNNVLLKWDQEKPKKSGIFSQFIISQAKNCTDDRLERNSTPFISKPHGLRSYLIYRDFFLHYRVEVLKISHSTTRIPEILGCFFKFK